MELPLSDVYAITHQPIAGGSNSQNQHPNRSLLSSPLRDLGQFYIKKSGLAARYAADEANNKLFSYSEEVVPNSGRSKIICVNFLDLHGTRFLHAEVDSSGTRVFGENTQIGVLDSIRGCTTMCQGVYTFSGGSTVGLGDFTFRPLDANGGFPCFCIKGCFCSYDTKYDILVNGKSVGYIQSNRTTGHFMDVKMELDPRLKALIVVGAFMLHNAYWKYE